MSLKTAVHMKTTLQTTTTATSRRDRIVFANSNFQLAFKGLKCHNAEKPKKQVIPIIIVSANSLEITANTGLSFIFQYDQRN